MKIFLKYLGYVPVLISNKEGQPFSPAVHKGHPSVNINIIKVFQWTYDDFLLAVLQAENPCIEQGVLDCKYELERVTRKRLVSKIFLLIVWMFFSYVLQISCSHYAGIVAWFTMIYSFYVIHYFHRQEKLYAAKKRIVSELAYINK